MQFLGTDTNFSPIPEFKTIGKPGGGVYINSSRIHPVKEILGVGIIFSDDAFRVPGAIFVDVIHRLFHRPYNF